MKTYNILVVSIVLVALSTTGCEEALETDFNADTIQLLAPGDSISTASPVNFYWQSVEGATKYRLQLVSPSFDSIRLLIADTLVTKNILSLPLNTGTYEWRVQALNNGSTSLRSESRSLIIQ